MSAPAPLAGWVPADNTWSPGTNAPLLTYPFAHFANKHCSELQFTDQQTPPHTHTFEEIRDRGTCNDAYQAWQQTYASEPSNAPALASGQILTTSDPSDAFPNDPGATEGCYGCWMAQGGGPSRDHYFCDWPTDGSDVSWIIPTIAGTSIVKSVSYTHLRAHETR